MNSKQRFLSGIADERRSFLRAITARQWVWIHTFVILALVMSGYVLRREMRHVGAVILAAQVVRLALFEVGAARRQSTQRMRLLRRLANKTQQPTGAPSGAGG
jgi:hypothetical protein